MKSSFLSILFLFTNILIIPSKIINSTIADINGDQILLSDIMDTIHYYQYTNTKYDKNEIFSNIINNKILKLHYKDFVNKPEIKTQINMQMNFIRKQIEEHCYKILNEYFKGNEEEFFKNTGSNIQDYIAKNVETQKEQIISSIIMQNFTLEKNFSPKKIKKLQHTQHETNENNLYEISELVIFKNTQADKTLINNIYRKIKNDKNNFEKIIKEYSNSKIDLGWIDILLEDNELNPYILKLKKDEISDIIDTDNAYYIIKWTEKDNTKYNVIGLTLYKNIDINNTNILDLLTDIKNKIQDKKLSWEEAVTKYSQNKENKKYYGVILNENNEEILKKEDINETDYNIITNLKEGEISSPIKFKHNKKNI